MPKTTAENTLALAFVVLVNWLLAHLENDWVMPPEVQSALQSAFTVLLGAHFQSRENKRAQREATNQRVMASDPPPPPPPANQPDPPPVQPELKKAA